MTTTETVTVQTNGDIVEYTTPTVVFNPDTNDTETVVITFTVNEAS